MSEQVDYRELEKLVMAQPQVHMASYYINAQPRPRMIYDQTIRMGQGILEERDTVQLSPQTMVDLAVQSINNAIKVLKGSTQQPATQNQSTGAASPVTSNLAAIQSAVSQAKQRVTASERVTATTTPASVNAHQGATSNQSRHPQTVTAPIAPAASTVTQAHPSTTTPESPAAEEATAVVQPTTPAEESSAGNQPVASSASTDQAAPKEAVAVSDQSTVNNQQPVAKTKFMMNAKAAMAVNSTQQDVSAAAEPRPSVGVAVWRGLRWTLGFRG